MTEINRQNTATEYFTPFNIGCVTGFVSLFAAREHIIWNKVEKIYDRAHDNTQGYQADMDVNDIRIAADLPRKRAMYATSIEQVQNKAKFWKKFGLAFGALSLLSFAYYAFTRNNNSQDNFKPN